MAAIPATQPALNWASIRDQAAAFITAEYASLDRSGAPITSPVTPYPGINGQSVDVSTGLTYPLKAERARRNPKVSLPFSQPYGAGLADPATFVIYGLATVRDADLRSNSARYLVESSARLPQLCENMPTPVLRRMAFYWARIWIEGQRGGAGSGCRDSTNSASANRRARTQGRTTMTMTTDPNTPADTRINGIVHNALRRDLARTQTALRAPEPPLDTQRVAIADHLVWMTEFLHMHHGAEDGLWALIRRLNPDAGSLLDQMAADHSRISPEIDRLRAAATNYRADGSPEGLQALASSLEALEVELLPHLRREEDEMMPIVARTLTRAQWDKWDKAANIAPKSMHELGIEGHWLIDSVNQERYDVVVHQVPIVLRFVLLHGYAHLYRRACAARWGPNVDVAPPAKRRRAMAADAAARRVRRSFRTEGTVSLDIEAAPRELYDIVADVTRTGERSPECRTCTWLPGLPPATVGARFRGHNKARHLRWSRVCEVVAADPGVEFAFRTVPERVDRTRQDSTTWSYTFTPERQRTRVAHSYRITVLPARPLWWLYCRIFPQHTDMRPQMLQNLEALRRQTEALGRCLARRENGSIAP